MENMVTEFQPFNLLAIVGKVGVFGQEGVRGLGKLFTLDWASAVLGRALFARGGSSLAYTNNVSDLFTDLQRLLFSILGCLWRKESDQRKATKYLLFFLDGVAGDVCTRSVVIGVVDYCLFVFLSRGSRFIHILLHHAWKVRVANALCSIDAFKPHRRRTNWSNIINALYPRERPNMSSCQLEVKSLDGHKVLFEDVPVMATSIEDVFGMVQTVEDPTSQWKLMAVVNGRLVPMHWAEKDRKLSELGFEGKEQYRVEVCLAWPDLKKVLT